MQNKTNKKVTQLLITASTLSMAVSTALYAAQPQGVQISDDVNSAKQISPLPKRYIVKYKTSNNATFGLNNTASISDVSVKAKLASLGAKVKSEHPALNMLTAELSAADIAALRKDSNVEYVEEDLPRRLMAQTQPYGISMVQADQVDDYVASAAAGGKKICIIDSGLNLPHEDMGVRNDTIGGTNDSGTGNWYVHGGPHGTHVAGTIAALNNGLGVRGVIGSNPNLHIVKVFNEAGWGYSSELVDAINVCKNAGASVVNMSLGGAGSTTTEKNGIKAAYDSGMLLIAAAGNDGVATSTTDAMSYPASYDSVMSVAAIDSAKVLADFSQKNSQVEIAGPGVDVYSTYPTGLGSVIDLNVAGTSYTANAMENQGQASGSLYDFATGESIDNGAAGRICLIQRGNISFHDKVKNCESSGGVGAIIYNNAAGAFGGTLGDTNTTTIPGVTVSDTDGATMKTQAGLSASINIGAGDYGKMSGTSMASPHVAGVAALVWSHHPNCTNVEIRNVLNATAQDLGAAGRDVKFGYGLAQTKDAIDYITANGCDGNGGTPPPPPPPTGDTVLVNGVAKTSLTAATGAELMFTMDVPAGASAINFATAGGSGDVDMYVRFGSAPTDSSYDCRPYKNGNAESCDVTDAGGTYYVRLKAYSTFSGVSLTGTYTEGDTGGDLPVIDQTKTNVSVARRSWTRYTVDLAAGYASFDVTLSGGSGDADLYIRHGAASTTSSFDCKSESSSNNESCSQASPAAGTWYIDVYGYRASSGMTLTVKANP